MINGKWYHKVLIKSVTIKNMHIYIYVHAYMYPCVYINAYNQATDFIYAGIYKTRVHAICLWLCLNHTINTVKQNISIVNQWTQKFSVDHQEVPACCGGMHDLLVFIFHVINDLCKNFPNHVSICLSLQDIRNMNFSLLFRCINALKIRLKMSCATCRPFCLNVLTWSFRQISSISNESTFIRHHNYPLPNKCIKMNKNTKISSNDVWQNEHTMKKW